MVSWCDDWHRRDSCPFFVKVLFSPLDGDLVLLWILDLRRSHLKGSVLDYSPLTSWWEQWELYVLLSNLRLMSSWIIMTNSFQLSHFWVCCPYSVVPVPQTLFEFPKIVSRSPSVGCFLTLWGLLIWFLICKSCTSVGWVALTMYLTGLCIILSLLTMVDKLLNKDRSSYVSRGGSSCVVLTRVVDSVPVISRRHPNSLCFYDVSTLK